MNHGHRELCRPIEDLAMTCKGMQAISPVERVANSYWSGELNRFFNNGLGKP